MLLSRILGFTLTSRCAIFASGTKKAWALSLVSSPPSTRRFMATWTGEARGMQCSRRYGDMSGSRFRFENTYLATNVALTALGMP